MVCHLSVRSITSRPAKKLAGWLVCAASGLLTLTGCSLATSIQRDALDYNATVANYNDQVLLYTILRARDEAPINIVALSTINGALNIQGGLGGSSTYSSHSTDPKLVGTLAPSLAAASSPTWSMASLNTQAFMLGIIQPVSPMYIVSKWNTGIDREFLLRLFIKSIEIKQDGQSHQYLNDPQSPRAAAEFAALVHSWLPGMRMRSLTVLEPLGPTFDPAAVTTTRTFRDDPNNRAAPSRIETQQTRNATMETLLEAYEHLIPLGSGPYFVGNARPDADGAPPRLQLYREYPQQVVLCVPKSTLSGVRAMGPVAPMGMIEEEAQEEEAALSNYALQLKAAATEGAGRESAPPASHEAIAGHATPKGSNGPPHAQRPAALGNELRTDRVAAVLPLGACGKDELVLPPFTEEQNSGSSAVYSHVEWRSVAEVIEYLSTLLREDAAAPAAGWDETDETRTNIAHVLFHLGVEDKSGFATVEYRGTRYTVHSVTDTSQSDRRDHSMQTLSLLNELVSVAKVSSDIPNTQSIQIIP